MREDIEVEVRAFLANRRKVERLLKKQGARLLKRLYTKDFWYCDARIKNYKDASIDSTGYALRLRELRNWEGSKKVISLECKTLVNKKSHSLCNEYEVTINSAANGKKLLENIGLKNFLIVEKKRTVYVLGDMVFYFDSIKGIGEGLEIEMMVPKSNMEKAHRAIRNFIKAIGVRENELLEKSLTRLAMERFSHFSR